MYINIYMCISGRAKKTLAGINETSGAIRIPHTPSFNVGGHLSVLLSVRKKRSFLYLHVHNACRCNIEVGGAGDVLLQ